MDKPSSLVFRANVEDHEQGKFWQSRHRAVRIYDEASLLACAANVDLNPIRAALAERLEESAGPCESSREN